MISYNTEDIYYQNIDIEISPEDKVLYNFEMDNIPDTVNIAYCDFTDIITLFNSDKGGIILSKALNNEISLNIFPTDSVGITKEEKIFLDGHDVIFRKKNINLYQTWYNPKYTYEYYLGCTIHNALADYIENFREYIFDESNKTIHFLTLNNLHTPARESLFKFYDSLDVIEKNKFLCSFRFKGVELDTNLPSIMNHFNIIFGDLGKSHYENTLIEIVSESSDIAITEKSFKAILAGVPFIHWINPSLDGYHHQIEFLKEIGIDSEYFGIDYSNTQNVKDKIKELLSLSIQEILVKYKSDFEKAHKNKIKFYEWVDDISKKLLK